MAAIANAKRRAAKIAKRLSEAFPDAACSLNFRSPLELLVATILSAQCTDVRVNQVTKTLFRKYSTAGHYAQAKLSELERDIQSTGFFRNKAKSIQNCCRTLLEQYNGQVPKDIDQLVELPGIGRKTASVVLGTAYGIAVGVVVDTHVIRISRRLGLTSEKVPEKIERELMEQFAEKEWIALSHRLIYHGRRYCTARNPKCDECPLESLCPRIGVEEK
jgi:endonuclease III